MGKKQETIIPITSIIDDKEEALRIGIKENEIKDGKIQTNCVEFEAELEGEIYMFHLLKMKDDRWFAVSILHKQYGEFNENTGLYEETFVETKIDDIRRDLPIQLSLF